ncbi:hypothetical protein D3C77_356890 [compost metagenome]
MGTLQFRLQPLLEIASIVDAGQGVRHRQRPQLFLDPLEIGYIRDIAVPERPAIIHRFRGRLTPDPAQSGQGQQHPVLFAPGRQVLGRVADRRTYPPQVIRMNTIKHRRSIQAQQAGFDFVDVPQPFAGIAEARAAIRAQTELINTAGHLGTELVEQSVTGREGVMDTFALGDINANRQVPHPQAMLVQHRRHQHVGQQVAAVLALQGPFTRLAAAFLDSFGEHRLGQGDLAAITHAQGPGPLLQLLGRHQGFQGQAAHGLSAGVAEHAFGAGVEGADHPAQAGGDDRNLGRSIQHTAQLIVGVAQGLFADAQLARTLLDQGQGALTLAEQTEQQGTEHQAEQSTEKSHCGHRRRPIGLHECLAGAYIQLVVVVCQMQQMAGSQRRRCALVA